MSASQPSETEIRTLVARRYPDDEHLRGVAIAAADTVRAEEPSTEAFDAIAQRYAAALEALEMARAELTGAIIATSGPETSIAERAGVTRMTVRKARGK